jgi:hypothetical protein
MLIETHFASDNVFKKSTLLSIRVVCYTPYFFYFCFLKNYYMIKTFKYFSKYYLLKFILRGIMYFIKIEIKK